MLIASTAPRLLAAWSKELGVDGTKNSKETDHESNDRAEANSESPSRKTKSFWNFYRTAADNSPVKEFLDELSDVDAAAVATAMREVASEGKSAARHLQREIYEV